jgi:predicted membrane GTPase involved in stress response
MRMLAGDVIKALDEKGAMVGTEPAKVLKLLRRRGMERFVINEAIAGDIISLAGNFRLLRFFSFFLFFFPSSLPFVHVCTRTSTHAHAHTHKNTHTHNKGLPSATVNHTICHPSVTSIIPSIPIDPPTLSMTFSVNDSPLAGKEGSALNAGVLKARLIREAENNVSIKRN